MKRLILISTLVLLAGCAKSDSSSPGGDPGGGTPPLTPAPTPDKPVDDSKILATPASGTLYSKAFSLGQAVARRVVIDGVDMLQITFGPKGASVNCLTTPADRIGAVVPAKIGAFKKAADQLTSVYFVSLGNNQFFAATEAVVRIDSISATQIRGGLYGVYSRASCEVAGTFTAEMCN